MAAESVPATLIIFQRRRMTVWRKVRPWLIATLATFAVSGVVLLLANFFNVPHVRLEIEGDEVLLPVTWTLFLLCFVVVGAAMIVSSVVVNEEYRCPRCETVPSVVSSGLFYYEKGVDIDPVACRECGARLR